MGKFTTWITPCPECDFKAYGQSGVLTGPEFHEEGDKCPRCNVGIRIKIRDAGSPLAYAYAEIDHR